MQVSLSQGRNQDPEGVRGAGLTVLRARGGRGTRDMGAGASGCNAELCGGMGLRGLLLKFPSFFLFVSNQKHF